MNTNRYADFDEYGLKHFAADLYDLELYSELYEHTISREWFDAQIAFDPSRQTYAESLDWALRAAEADPHSLPTLLTLTLLRPTLEVLATQVPTAALEVMARHGAVQRAESYAELRSDLPSKCEALCCIADVRRQRGDTMGARETLLRAKSVAVTITDPSTQTQGLCRIARALWQCEDDKEARETLSQAEREAMAIVDQRSRTRLLARVAVIAQEIGAPETLDRAVQAVQAVFERDKSLAAVIARKLNLLDRPDYLLALAEWEEEGEKRSRTIGVILDRPDYLLGLAELEEEGEKRSRTIGVLHSEDDALAVIAPVAAAQKDDALLDEILAQAQSKEWFSDYRPGDIVEALTEADRVDDAFALMETWRRHHGFYDVPLRRAMARAAGRRGDLETIERAISPVYSKRGTGDRGDGLDWEERFYRLGASVARLSVTRLVERVGRRVAGMGHLEKLSVLLAGIEGLADEHPEQARALWERAKAEKGWLWRRMAPIVEELSLTVVQFGYDRYKPAASTENGRPPESAGLAGVLFKLRALAARWHDETVEHMQYRFFRQALDAAQKIASPDRRAVVLAGVADAALEMDSYTSKRMLDRAAEALARLPWDEAGDEAVRLLDPFTAHADQLGWQEWLVRAEALPALMRETARFGSVEDALRMVQALGPHAIFAFAVLPALCEVTVMQGDTESARQLLAWAKKARKGYDLSATASNDLAKALAQMAAQWAKAAAAEGHSPLAKQWTDLAAQAFRLAQSQTQWLPPEWDQRWHWPSLALAARHLKDKSALSALHKQAKKLASTQRTVQQALADQILVHVNIGLASPRDSPGLSLFEEIWHREYRAQVQAEMSEVTRSLPPQKKLFWTYRSKEDLQFDAKLLLDKVREQLTPTEYTSGFRLSDSLLFGRHLSQKRAIDKRSIFVTMGQESLSRTRNEGIVAMVPRRKDQALLEKSGREALARAFEALARAGRYRDIVEIAQNTPPPSDQPVIATAVKALAQVGQVKPARRLLQDLESKQDKGLALVDVPTEDIMSAEMKLLMSYFPGWRTRPARNEQRKNKGLALAGLAGGLTASDVAQAETLLDQALHLLWNAPHPEMTLAAVAEASTNLSSSARWRVLCNGLRAGRERGRAGALVAIAAFAPVAATLMDATQWRETVEQIVETETWFSFE